MSSGQLPQSFSHPETESVTGPSTLKDDNRQARPRKKSRGHQLPGTIHWKYAQWPTKLNYARKNDSLGMN